MNWCILDISKQFYCILHPYHVRRGKTVETDMCLVYVAWFWEWWWGCCRCGVCEKSCPRVRQSHIQLPPRQTCHQAKLCKSRSSSLIMYSRKEKTAIKQQLGKRSKNIWERQLYKQQGWWKWSRRKCFRHQSIDSPAACGEDYGDTGSSLRPMEIHCGADIHLQVWRIPPWSRWMFLK